MQLRPNETFSVVRQLDDPFDAGTYYVQAKIRDARTDALIATLNLEDKDNQRFVSNWVVAEDPSGLGRYIDVETMVYTDSGYTTVSEQYRRENKVYLVQDRDVNFGGGSGGPDIDYKKIEKMIQANKPETVKVEKSEKEDDITPRIVEITDLLKKLDAKMTAEGGKEHTGTRETLQKALNEMKEELENGIQEVKNMVDALPDYGKVDLEPVLSKMDELKEETNEPIKKASEVMAFDSQKVFQQLTMIIKLLKDFPVVTIGGAKVPQEEKEVEEEKPQPRRRNIRGLQRGFVSQIALSLFLGISAIAGAFFVSNKESEAPAVGDTVGTIEMWKPVTVGPTTYITQRIANRAVKLSGYSDGCAEFGPNGILSSTGVACGTGSGSGTVGPGQANQIAYFDSTTTIASLATSTYPNLTELSYVKGVTSAIQTQLDSKLDGSLTTARVPFADDSNTLIDSADFTLSPSGTGGSVIDIADTVAINNPDGTPAGTLLADSGALKITSNTSVIDFGANSLDNVNNATVGGDLSLTALSDGCLYTSSGQVLSTASPCGSGGGSPAGSNGELQFNASGSFGATTTLFWDQTNGFLGIGTTTPRGGIDVYKKEAFFQPQVPGSGFTPNDIYGYFRQTRGAPNGMGFTLVDPTYAPSGVNLFKFSAGRLGYGTGNLSASITDAKMEFRGTQMFVDALNQNSIYFGENDSSNNNYMSLWHTDSSATNDTFYFTTQKVASSTDRPSLYMGAEDFSMEIGQHGTIGNNPIVFNISKYGEFKFTLPASTTIGHIIKGFTSQTADLSQWQDVSSTVLSRVKADGNMEVPDEAYGSGWNGKTEVPTKNALYDKIETLSGMAIGGSITSATEGSALFAGASGVLAQDNANYFWDDTNNYLGLGLANPAFRLNIQGTTLATAGARFTRASADSFSGTLDFRKARGGIGSEAVVSAADILMRLQASGYDGSAYDSVGTLNFAADSISGGVVAGAFIIGTANTAGTVTNALYINKDQKTGLAYTPNAAAGRFTLGGSATSTNRSTNGAYLTINNASIIAADDGSSGTVTHANTAAFFGSQFAASSATTYTNASTLYIGGTPTANTNVTVTNAWALYVNAGNSHFAGGIRTASYLQSTNTAGNAFLIYDGGANEMLRLVRTTSAVNEHTLTNAATGANPQLSATGGDTNVGLDFLTKAAGVFRLLGNSTKAAELRLLEDTDNGTNYTAFKVGTQAGDVTYTLPTADGTSGYVLSTNGSGTLSWVVNGSGGSGITRSVIATSTDFTPAATASTDYVYMVDNTAANVTITMPTAVGNTNRYTFVAKDVSGTFGLIFNTTSGQTISTNASGVVQVLGGTNVGATVIISDGANWWLESII